MWQKQCIQRTSMLFLWAQFPHYSTKPRLQWLRSKQEWIHFPRRQKMEFPFKGCMNTEWWVWRSPCKTLMLQVLQRFLLSRCSIFEALSQLLPLQWFHNQGTLKLSEDKTWAYDWYAVRIEEIETQEFSKAIFSEHKKCKFGSFWSEICCMSLKSD